MNRLTNLLLIVGICAAAWTVGHRMGFEQAGGFNRIAAANERIADSYGALAAQLERIKPYVTAE